MATKKEVKTKNSNSMGTAIVPSPVPDNKGKKSKASRRFVIALSIVSIIGFLSIVLKTLFYVDVENYMSTAWFITLGLGLSMEASFKQIKNLKKDGLTPEVLGELTMLIVGSMAIIAGILSLPQIGIDNPSFLAVKGIISILGIIFIILQTWVAEEN